MTDLFDVNVSTMHHKDYKDTEKQAAELIASRVTGLRLIVLQVLYDNPQGMTGEQVASKADEWLYSIKPRITELCRYELVEDTGDRIRNSRNRNEVVWAITDKGKEIMNGLSKVQERN
jgi:hypothetical protein